MTANINVTSYEAWFEVETDHDTHRLEFVLIDAAERGGKDRDFYWVQLGMALQAACNAEGTSIVEEQVYGSVSFRIAADSQAQLQDGLAACELAVQAWVKKYNVNRMKA